jgi:uncharacterized protein (DUF2062 family)
MPDHKEMREHPHLRRFGERLTEPRLWHLNRRSVAGGVALGLFVAYMPVLGQMFIAAALAIIFRVNLPLSVMGVWLTNPLTIPPMFYFAYMVGAWILNIPAGEHSFVMSWEWFTTDFLAMWQPLVLGSLICGTVAALLGVVVVRLIWRIVVIRSWMKRQNKS